MMNQFLFILPGGCLHAFGVGVVMAFPAVLNPAILNPNTTDIRATSDEASWIASSNGFSGAVGFFILSPIFQCIGRRSVNILLNVIYLLGWIIIVFANSVATLLLARIVQGLATGGIFIVSISLSEYVHPKKRGYFSILKKASLGIGSLACHCLGIIWTWRQIAMFCLIPVALSIIVTGFWPETPAFLAMKGRYDECEKSFTWLNGDSMKKKKELKELIAAQIESKNLEHKHTSTIMGIIKTFVKRDFQKSFVIVTFVILAIDSCGRYFLLAYITRIMVDIVGDTSVAVYCSILSDCLLIIALSISCFVIRLFKRRSLLFILGSLTVGLMFLISITIVLKTKLNVNTPSWLTPALVLLHSFIANIGIIPVGFAISGEIFPLQDRGLGACTSGVLFTLFLALTLKITPIMIESIGVEGTYAVYGLLVSLSLGILFILLPETKDKTLQQIEDEIKGVKRCVMDVDLIHSEIKRLPSYIDFYLHPIRLVFISGRITII